MYEYLKDLIPVAELVGEPMNIHGCSGDAILGDYIRIAGITPDGRKYTMELVIEKEATDAGQS